MFNIFSAPRAVGEVLGVVSERDDLIIIDDQLDIEPVKPVAVKLEATVFEPCGIVEAHVEVKDPNVDKAILEELFGVYRSSQKIMELSCPGCEHETEQPYVSAHLEDMVCCSECDYEAELNEFLDDIVTRASTSRTPTDDEVSFVVGSHRHHQARDVLKKYYALLTGADTEPLTDRELSGDHRFDGIDENGTYQKSCNGCQSPGDGCQCRAEKFIYFGKLRPLSEMSDDSSEVD
jgi:hypothetical protein